MPSFFCRIDLWRQQAMVELSTICATTVKLSNSAQSWELTIQKTLLFFKMSSSVHHHHLFLGLISISPHLTFIKLHQAGVRAVFYMSENYYIIVLNTNDCSILKWMLLNSHMPFLTNTKNIFLRLTLLRKPNKGFCHWSAHSNWIRTINFSINSGAIITHWLTYSKGIINKVGSFQMTGTLAII